MPTIDLKTSIIFALEFLWTLLITALIGNVIADAYGGTPSQVNYCMFVAVFSWIVLIIGFTESLINSIPPVVLLAADALAVFFTFVAAVLLSAKLGVHSCGNSDYLLSNDTITGSLDLSKRCHELQASCAFFWFLFATYCAAFALNVRNSRGSSGLSSRVGIHKGGPAMSQV